MANKYIQVVKVLQMAKDEIANILTSPDDEMHLIWLTNALKQNIERVNLATGVGDLDTEVPVGLQRATTIGGKPLQFPKKIAKGDISPSAEKVNVLRGKVEQAFQEFPSQPAKQILKDYEENVIRGVAKKAQMKVTADDPAKITLPFIDKIKKEIKVFTEKQTAAEAGADASTNLGKNSAADDFLK
jgi:hypothetical protein